ncbi:MAG: hypothetical protein QOI01_3391 [Mycobacterium sp.]|jgi:hypothetical protein|nr:hypothetical protein [Mycobacterium sp.]
MGDPLGHKAKRLPMPALVTVSAGATVPMSFDLPASALAEAGVSRIVMGSNA